MTTAREQIHVSREWLDLAKRLPPRGRVLVVGASDSGKTTLCRWLMSRLPMEARPALADADTGQSQIGPPGCVGWRFAGTHDFGFFFAGDTTAATCPVATLAATVRAVTAAEAAGATVVLVDTSGYIGGRGGFDYKCAKVEVLAPAHVIVLGDSPEIKRLLAAWRTDDRVTIHRLSQSERLQQKTREQRTAWRTEKWAEQFAGTDLRRISLQGKVEAEIAQLEPEDRALFLEEYGIAEPGASRVIRLSYELLGIQSFFTVGEDEVRAWSVPVGATAVEAAGVIHTDLARGFIRAEVTAFADLQALGDMKAVKAAGKQRLEGKTYTVQDGDIITVRFNI